MREKREETAVADFVDFSRGVWLNPPPEAELQDGVLHVTTGELTDFWRETHYGFVRDNGHFLSFDAGFSFTAELRVQASYETLYDQAGLMLRRDARHWIKAGVEHSDGTPCLSTVVTRERSDWALTTAPFAADDIRLRMTVREGAVRIQVSGDGALWTMLRLADFPTDAPLTVGPTCCTPERAGLRVRFRGFAIGPAISTDLHDQS